MGFIVEFIVKLFSSIILEFILSVLSFIIRDLIFDGIKHALLFFRFGLEYKRHIDASYPNTRLGIAGKFSANVIMLFWVIVLCGAVFYLIYSFF